MKKTISIVLIIIWMAVIFWFSSMPGDESNTKSKSTIKEAIEIITQHGKAEKIEETISNEESVNEVFANNQIKNNTEINKVNQNQTMQNEPKEEQLIEKLNKPLRKCMHTSVYFVLSILICNCLKIFKISGLKNLIMPIGISFLYACTDELHQLFVEGRTSQFTDVLIDTTGAIIGVTIFTILLSIISNLKNTKNFRKTIAQKKTKCYNQEVDQK